MMCSYPVFQDSIGALRKCGQCTNCRINKKREKQTRQYLESLDHSDILFLTLTYDNAHLPTEWIHPKTGQVFEHPDGVLHKCHIQNFVKRLRKSGRNFRYFFVGEYGDDKWRPHYHAIIYGINFHDRDIFYRKWSEPYTHVPYCDPRRLTVEQPRDDWAVFNYVDGYTVKKMTNPKDDRLEGRSPEFFLSSLGIGLSFVDKYVSAMDNVSGANFLSKSGDVPYQLIINGKKLPIDHYMRTKLREKLQVSESAEKVVQAKLQEEMQVLQKSALQNPKIPKKWIVDPSRRGWALENQALHERAPALKTLERKQALFEKNHKKGDFNV